MDKYKVNSTDSKNFKFGDFRLGILSPRKKKNYDLSGLEVALICSVHLHESEERKWIKTNDMH